MMSSRWWHKIGAVVVAILLSVTGCGEMGQSAYEEPAGSGDGEPAAGDDEFDEVDEDQEEDGDPGDDDSFEPEEEEFIVEEVAATDSYVFVPNQTDESDTVALIDGRDFSVEPIRVGLNPNRVEAADVDDQGAVAYVLSRGDSTVSVIRADVDSAGQPATEILPVPPEVNELALAPGGRHLIAYIDPDEPIDDTSSASSLQTMAMVRLGDEPGTDGVFELSVTPYIEDITFVDDGNQLFVVGADGIHRVWLEEVKSDTMVPSMQLELDGMQLDGDHREVTVSSDGTALAIRNGQDAAVGLFELAEEASRVEASRVVELDGVPTDLELVERNDSVELVAPVRAEQQVVTFDFHEAMEADDGDGTFVDVIEASGAEAGIGRWTPDESAMVVFSTLSAYPRVGLVDIETGDVEVQQLRNQIRNLEISPDSQTAVAVHRRQTGGTGGDPEEEFRYSEGLTLWDLASGFLRPVILDGEPDQIVMVNDSEERPQLYVMLTPTTDSSGDDQGVMRINLHTHATEFYSLPRLPTQLGAVGDHIFVGQQQETGRITFFDINTGDQRTVSGYELNAGIQ